MSARKQERLFTFKSGGWVLLLAGLITLAGTVWNLVPLFDPHRVRPRGDGRRAQSYDFDLGATLVPRDKIVSSGMVTDALPPLTNPKTITLAELSGLETVGRGQYLVPTDKVIGIVEKGRARAYPLRVLVWHEVVNDVVSDLPIAVTYNPLSEGIAVFDRRVAGVTLTFGVSGLLYQSNLLMYDRAGTHAEQSLWSQLQARAVAGPEAVAGRTLEIVPFALARWKDWKEAHPDTTVLAPVEGDGSKYGQDVYGSYFNSEELRFPVDPLPPHGAIGMKTRVFVTGSQGAWSVTPLPVQDDESRFSIVGPSGTTPVAGFYAFWFAWYATHPEAPGTPAAGTAIESGRSRNATARVAASSPDLTQSGTPNAPRVLPARNKPR